MPTILSQILEETKEIKTMNFDLGRMRIFDAAIGSPSQAFQSIHIAGTNGKGSVAHKIASALPGKIGLYTSPHIKTYRERISIDGSIISEEKGEVLLSFILGQLPERPTYFELLTLLAFAYFAEEKVDIAVIEVGMGGRLDATNIICPILSVITSIDLEHTQYLGKTLEEIAKEKGGIIKKGVPLIVGPRARYYSNAIEVTGEFVHYEEENQAIAKEVLNFLKIDSYDLSNVPSCRFEKRGNVILDVAHNPAALKSVFRRITDTYPDKKIRALIAFSADKDIEGCLAVIRDHTIAYHYIQSDHSRLYKPKKALSFQEAFDLADDKELILICGTFFIMADALVFLHKRSPWFKSE
ncbi:MAG: Mur ligase family protein [Chlamydiales bacterium]